MNSERTKIRVASVDDHEIMQGGIRFVLMAFDDLEHVGDASRGEDAVQLCRDVNPDVVLVDMKMQGFDGVQTTSAIRAACAEVQVLILTSFHDPDLVRRAMRAGAVGYVLKDASKEELAAAIRAASEGQTTISAGSREGLAGRFQRHDHRVDGPRTRGARFVGKRNEQQGDRQATAPQSLHSPPSRQSVDSKAGSIQSRRSGRHRDPAKTDPLTRIAVEATVA